MKVALFVGLALWLACSIRFVSADSLDSDNDGMPDAWEDSYGFDKYLDWDAAYDADEDGFTNLDEYLGGSDPRDMCSPWQIPGWCEPVTTVKFAVTKSVGGQVEVWDSYEHRKILACGKNCSTEFEGRFTDLYLRNLEARAIPDPGYLFKGWSGDCEGGDATCTIAGVYPAKTVRAVFVLNYPVIKGWRYHP